MIRSYAAMAPKKNLEPFQYILNELNPTEVDIEVTHCGICHSDIHLIDNDWEISQYPLVPGHEIVGIVTAAGREVKHLQPGQRVGVGWQASCCHHCAYCAQGEKHLCELQKATCVGEGRFGGFSRSVRVDSSFAVPIPDKLPSAEAAPLLCAGITVFSPLYYHKVNPTTRLAIVGIGGLGHLALQFARAFGCSVTAFSTSPEKEHEALSFGADRFVLESDEKAFEREKKHYDFILVTSFHEIDINLYATLLHPRGKIVLVGAIEKPLSFNAFSLILGSKALCGSNIGDPFLISKMLEVAARHEIHPQIEIFSLNDVNIALNKVRANKVRYRAVLNCKGK